MLRPLTEYEACLQEERNHQWAVSKGAPILSAKFLVHLQTCRLQHQQRPQPFHTYEIMSNHDSASAAHLLFTELVTFKFWVGCLLHSSILLLPNFCLISCFKNGQVPDYPWWEALFLIIIFVVLIRTFNRFWSCEEDIFSKISSRWDRKRSI